MSACSFESDCDVPAEPATWGLYESSFCPFEMYDIVWVHISEVVGWKTGIVVSEKPRVLRGPGHEIFLEYLVHTFESNANLTNGHKGGISVVNSLALKDAKYYSPQLGVMKPVCIEMQELLLKHNCFKNVSEICARVEVAQKEKIKFTGSACIRDRDPVF